MAQQTPLAETHRALGARMIEFAGWRMPVHYAGILAEHRAVRNGAGIFDLSHMGEIEIRGPQAGEVCRELFVTDTARLRIGQAQYSLLCSPRGGIVDDVMLYRLAEQRYFVCVNAANTATDYAWMRARSRGRAEVIDRSDEYALIALQGRGAQAALTPLAGLDLSAIRRYWSARTEVAGVPALVARTGYTGEDGFEVFLPAGHAEAVWDACGGNDAGSTVVPVGLGARNTLRLEAGYVLYGNDIDAHTTPLEAGLERLLRSDDASFIGSAALHAQRRQGVQKHLIGLRLDDAGIARRGYAIWQEGVQVGRVTSGTRSPTLGVSIALGYVPPACAEPGTRLSVAVRTRRVPATVVTRPFYRVRR